MITGDQLRDITSMVEGLNDIESSSNLFIFGGSLEIRTPADARGNALVGEVYATDDGFKFRTP